MAVIEVDTGERQASPEAERVLVWRAERLRAAGYPADAAERLAGSGDVDLHEAVALLAAGCPPETALRILL